MQYNGLLNLFVDHPPETQNHAENPSAIGQKHPQTPLTARRSAGRGTASSGSVRGKKGKGLNGGRKRKRRVEHLGGIGATTVRMRTERERGEARARATLVAQVLAELRRLPLHLKRKYG